MVTASRIVINCAGDNELASDVYNYLLTNLKPLKHNIEDFMTLAVDEIEVIDVEGKIPRDALRNMLSSYLESDSAKFGNNYAINELENIFTIGIKADLLKDMKICEYCGYMSKDYHDMYNHRLFCFSVSRLGG